jgi:hypothetical protein
MPDQEEPRDDSRDEAGEQPEELDSEGCRESPRNSAPDDSGAGLEPSAGSEPENGVPAPDGPEHVSAAFFHEVMTDLSDTNFARGWGDPAMYRDFLSWCESSPEADAIIAEFSPQIPSLVVDPDENVRFVSLHARVAAELMRALLDAYEEMRINEFLNR